LQGEDLVEQELLMLMPWTDWNLRGATAIISPAPAGAGKPAALVLVDLAIAETAIYEAVNAIAASPFESSAVTPTCCAPHFCAQHLGNTRKPVVIQELLGRTLRTSIVTSSVILQVAETMFRRLKETELLPTIFTLVQRIWKGWGWVMSMDQKIAALSLTAQVVD
jgi:hypothetical protein